MNEVNVCNLALAYAGNDRGIDSLDETNPSARYCKLLYPQIRDGMLREFAWNWATRKAALAVLTDTFDGWDYAYALPADCMTLIALEDEDNTPGVFYEWEIRAGSGSTVAICTDLEDAYGRYTRAVTDCNMMDTAFVDALTYRLASRLAMALSGDGGRAQMLGREADLALARAQALNANERRIDPYVSSYASARTA
jgi:hypothetical protein